MFKQTKATVLDQVQYQMGNTAALAASSTRFNCKVGICPKPGNTKQVKTRTLINLYGIALQYKKWILCHLSYRRYKLTLDFPKFRGGHTMI